MKQIKPTASFRLFAAAAAATIGLLAACGGGGDGGGTPAAITAQPTDRSVVEGATATFTVVASNAAGYQWQRSTNAGATYTAIGAATAASYTTAATTIADNGNRYRVIVSGATGNVASSAATLIVTAAVIAPAITVQPANQTVTAGIDVSFSVTATGTALVYQWQRSDDNGATFTNLAGATNATLTRGAVPLADNGNRFRVNVSNSAGNLNSSAAILTVNPAPVAPSFTAQPTDQSVTAPATATFSATAVGTPTLTLQWQLSADGGASFANIVGATGGSYTTPATVVGDSGRRYRAVATNSAGTVNSNVALLTVAPTPVAPSFTLQPADQTVTAPAAATFTAAASGTPTPTLQWQLSTDGGTSFANITSATGASYTSPATVIGDSGRRFRAVASNSAGTANSTAALLKVRLPPPIANTAAGLVEGVPTMATIGAAGGSLASPDGRVTVAVPPGALTADTVVGIQPITATAPGALGAYRLTAEGRTFAQPVTITFKYSTDQAAATAPDSLRIATHDARGYWVVVGTTRDPAARTLAVTTTRFSDWSYVSGAQLVPASATVAVNKELRLGVTECGDGADPDGNPQRLLLECIEQEVPPAVRNWSVNAIPGGNTTVGTVVAGLINGVYRAPAAVPSQNPVAVSADLYAGTTRTTLVSNIRVVDELTVYTGTIFGRTDISISGQTQFVEMSANLRFTYDPARSIGGDKWYSGTGTALVRGRAFGCTGEGSGPAQLQGADLVLHTQGPLAGTYTISSGALGTVTMTCGNPPAPVTLSLQGGAGAGGGGGSNCPALQIGADPGQLAGSWTCNVAEGTTQRANWTLRAGP